MKAAWWRLRGGPLDGEKRRAPEGLDEVAFYVQQYWVSAGGGITPVDPPQSKALYKITRRLDKHVEADWVPEQTRYVVINGTWYDRRAMPPIILGIEHEARFYPTGRFETREDGEKAEVFEERHEP